MEHRNAAVVRALYEARGRGDLQAAAALLAPDVEWHEPYEFLGDIHGREAVVEALREAVEATAGSFHIDLHDLLANDEHGIQLVHWLASKADRRVEWHGVHVYHFRDGRLDHTWVHVDPQQDVDDFLNYVAGTLGR